MSELFTWACITVGTAFCIIVKPDGYGIFLIMYVGGSTSLLCHYAQKRMFSSTECNKP